MELVELNFEVLKITLIIQEKYPELSKYLDEMPVTIPNSKKPEISLKTLRSYFESLTSFLQNYIYETKNVKY